MLHLKVLLLGLLSVAWKLAVLPVLLRLTDQWVRTRMRRRARADHPDVPRKHIDPAARRIGRTLGWRSLWGRGVLIWNTDALHFRQLYPSTELRVPFDEMTDVCVVTVEGSTPVLRVRTASSEVHAFRTRQAQAYFAAWSSRPVRTPEPTPARSAS